jgi:membrane protease YdiL (CAAX protease family)
VLTALLFAAAHVSWSGFPASVREWNLFPLLYAFAMGMLNGAVYQKTRSILYPMAMHSISNFVMVGTGYLFHLLQQA